VSDQPSVDRLAGLIEAAAAVVGESELDTVLRRLVKEAMSATGARYAALGVLGDHGVLSDFIYEGISDHQAEEIGDLPRGRGVLGTVIRERRTIRVDSIEEHPDAYGFPDHHPAMGSFLGVPVSAGAAAFGNLYLTEKEGGFTDEDVVFIEALSRIAGSAVQTARLQGRLRQVAIVEDRERIARDLHDSVIQDLFAVGLGLQSVSGRVTDKGVSSVLDESVDRLDDAVESLRAFIFELHVMADSPAALDENLQELISRMGSAYPSEVTLDIEIDDSLDPELEEELVKIVTEALSNALRHADASHVMVVTKAVDGHWSVKVVDNGVGFNLEETMPGMGLLNLKTRASKLGATYSIESQPGTGTTVEVKGRVS
jgi:signal transduction histidine kinase